MALTARQCHTGVGQARTCRAQIGTLLWVERTRIDPARGVWPRIIGAEVMAVVAAEQQPQRMPCIAQIQGRLARRIGHRQVVHCQPRAVDRRHRPGGNLLVRRRHLLGRTLAVGIGNLRPLLCALQSEIGFMQCHLLPAPGIEHVQPGHFQQRVRLADAQCALAAALPGPAQAHGAVHPLVLPASRADAMLGADLAGADRQLGGRAQRRRLHIALHAAQLQCRRTQVRVVCFHGALRFLQGQRRSGGRAQKSGQHGRKTRGEIHARHGKVMHLRQTCPNLARSLQCESC